MWIASLFTLISNSASFFSKPLVTVSIAIIFALTFDCCFRSLARSMYLCIICFLFFSLCNKHEQQYIQDVKFFCSCQLILSLVYWLRLSDSFVSQNSQWILFVSFSCTDSGLCIYDLFTCSNSNILYSSQWTPFPTQSSQFFYFFWASLLYSWIMRLTLSFLFAYILHLLSTFAFIWLVLMILFCAAIKRDSVSLMRFPLLTNVYYYYYYYYFIFNFIFVCLRSFFGFYPRTSI